MLTRRINRWKRNLFVITYFHSIIEKPIKHFRSCCQNYLHYYIIFYLHIKFQYHSILDYGFVYGRLNIPILCCPVHHCHPGLWVECGAYSSHFLPLFLGCNLGIFRLAFPIILLLLRIESS